MNTLNLTLLLQIAGGLHAGLLLAGASMPKAVNLHQNLATLPKFVRRLFYVYFGFIGMILLGFGILTFCFAGAMAAGQPVGRGLCVLMAVFWVVRLAVAAFVFDVRPYLTNWLYRMGNIALNLVFIYLVMVYVIAALKGGHL